MEPPLSIEARQHDQQQAVARKDNEIEDTHRVDILSIIIQAKLIAFRLSCAKEKHSIRLLVWYSLALAHTGPDRGQQLALRLFIGLIFRQTSKNSNA